MGDGKRKKEEKEKGGKGKSDSAYLGLSAG